MDDYEFTEISGYDGFGTADALGQYQLLEDVAKTGNINSDGPNIMVVTEGDHAPLEYLVSLHLDREIYRR